MDERMYVWCIASIRHALRLRIQNSRIPRLSYYYSSDIRDTNKEPAVVEIRIDGPMTLKSGTKNEWCLRVEVNLLIKTTRSLTDLYVHQKNVAVANKVLMDDICVSELGYEDSTKNSVGTFQLIQPGVVVAEHGQIDDNIEVQQATIEAHYEMYYETPEG